MASVNTNSGALTALSSLRSVNGALDVVSKRVETGYRVADASDNAAVFAVAQGVRSQIKAHASVQSSLQQGLGLVDVTLAGLNNVSNLIGDLRSTLTKASDGSLTDIQRTIYKNDALALHQQILDTLVQAKYNNRNQTLTTSTPVDFVADTAGTTITVGTFGINPYYDDLGTAINGITDAASATAAYQAIQPLDDATNSTSATFAATRRQITLQMAFNEDLLDAVKKGLGALVDADVAQDSATLQSLQVRQQLAVSALTIANNAPSSLLKLYR